MKSLRQKSLRQKPRWKKVQKGIYRTHDHSFYAIRMSSRQWMMWGENDIEPAIYPKRLVDCKKISMSIYYDDHSTNGQMEMFLRSLEQHKG